VPRRSGRALTATAITAVAFATAVACVPPPGGVPPRDGSCRQSYGAVTFEELEVPSGALCLLSGTTVQGNIRVQRGGALDANSVRVIGNVQAEGAQAVSIRGGSRIGGSVQVKQGGGASVQASFINGDIQFEANGLAMVIDANIVGGNIQVVGNRALTIVTSNRVDGNLQCKENTPATQGGGNIVQGNKEDQCAAL
jgi:hypothetical protein